jgi:hypothetical protein
MIRNRSGLFCAWLFFAIAGALFLFAAADTTRALIAWARGPEVVVQAPPPPPPAPKRHVPPASPRIIAY